MKIAYIAAGAAGMYCGSCLHDNTLASALIRKGHDVALVPTYTPLRTDETDVSIDHVFYGAVNVYLEQKSALFRRTPRVIDRLLGGKRLLDWVASRGASTNARDLGALTLSVLRGEDGHQRKELERLVAWLDESYRPDLVHLTNSMFLGLARTIRERLGVPVLCSVQGEDIFLDELVEPHRSEVHALLREKARDADGFVAPSRYYVDHMTRFLEVAPDAMHHVDLGIHLEGFDASPSRASGPYTIGYLARICPEKGLHLLADAFRLLAERAGRDRVRCKVAGYLGPRDRAYHDQVRARIDGWGLGDRVEFCGELDRTQKIAFLGSVDVLSVPTTYREPKGLFVLEALACGTPVVEPAHGAFPELVESSGGGILVEPDSAKALADGLGDLLDDPERRLELGRRGREFVRRERSDERMADATLELYRRYA